MKVIIKDRYRAEITKNVIDRVLSSLGLPAEYSTEYVKGDGRNIIIETEDRSIFVIISRESADARNAFLAQYIPTVLRQYINYSTVKRKSIFIYLLDTSYGAKTEFIIDTYKVAKTLGINILNEAELKIGEILPYKTFDEWKNAKTERQQYNSSNQSSYAIEDENGEYTLFGKLYGANGKEAALTACLLSQIAKSEGKRLNFVQVTEHGTECLSAGDKLLLNYYGVSFADGSTIVRDKKAPEKSTCRKQDEFKYNLLEKFGRKKCYLCRCDIESNIIASHVHRIADIDRSGLSDAEKRKQAVDGDNGFWLCANHDKLFENGQITFDRLGMLVINKNLSRSQIDFIKSITEVYKIKEEHLTEGLIHYLELHNKRVNLGLGF